MDFYTSYWHHYVHIQQPVLQPFGESKSNTDVFRLLAEAMGFEEAALQDADEELMRQALDYPENPSLTHITYDSLVKELYMKADRSHYSFNKLHTPSGKIELYSEQIVKDGYPGLPTYTPLVHDGDFPYLFVPAPNHNFLNSTFSNNEKHQKLEKSANVHLNQEDAKKIGITDGELVRIWNNRGECELLAAVGENVLPGVVVSQGLWADMPGKKQTVNALAPDRLADMGGGATFFSGRVNIAKIES